MAFCRDFAVPMTSILRHKGIPVRLRVGFEEYFITQTSLQGRPLDHRVLGWRRTAGSISTVIWGEWNQDLEERVKTPLKARTAT